MRSFRIALTLAAAAAALALVIPTDTASAQRRRRGGGSGKALKIATLAPEGTSWTRVLADLDKDLKQETGGELKLRVYAGGVQGDEKVVLRKMRLGQLHAGGFTGKGLGAVVPWVRLLELPFTYEDAREVDYVRRQLDDRLRAAFEAEGFVLIGWIDVGFAYMYSTRKIRTVADLKSAKPWLWEGDPLAAAAFSEVGVTPTPLALPDVLTSLSTGLIDTVYTSPMACVGLQWFTKVDYVNDLPLAHGTGGLLVTKAFFDELPRDQQEALRRLGDKHGRRLTEISRIENEDAQRTLKDKGIETIPFDAEEAARLRAIGRTVAMKVAGEGLFTRAQLDEALSHLEAYRMQQEGEGE